MSNSGVRNDTTSDAQRNQGARPNTGNSSSGTTFGNAEKVAADKAREATNRVSELTGQAKDKANEVTAQVSDKVSELAGQAKDKASELAGQAKDKAQEWATEAAQMTGATVKDLGNELTDLIRRYPAPALLIGFGLGFMIAKASSSSKH